MNANKLAEQVEEWDDGSDYGLHREVAAMLRQQQTEIEALKKLVHQRFDDGKRLGIIETEDRLRKAQEK